jgi:methionine biosynthesis protein MetW
MTEAKKELYDSLYESQKIVYTLPKGIISFFYKKLAKFDESRDGVVKRLLPAGKEKLLDMGCGSGNFLLTVKDSFDECYGIDISAARISLAKQKAKNCKTLNFFEGDIDEKLPFSDLFFDVVTANAVIEHVFNPPNVLTEIHRILKANGVVIIVVPNFAWLPNRIQLLFGKLPSTGGVYLYSDWEHLHNFTKSILCELLDAKGFEVKSISCCGVFGKYRRYWASLLGGDFVIKAHKKTDI